MAIVRLKDVEVTRLNNSGNGVRVTESNEHGGKTFKTNFTLWFKDPSGLSVGDRVSVSGFLGAKVGDPWTGQDGQERRSVELSVNSPRIEVGDGAGGGSGASSPAGGYQQSSSTVSSTQEPAQSFGSGFDDEQPF